MNFYPVYLHLRGKRCVVVGGGTVAERKTLSLIGAGGDVTVVSPELTTKLQALADARSITHRSKVFTDDDLAGAFLVIAATDDVDVNRRTARLCRERNVLVNAVTPPEESSFIVPSVVARDNLLIAVSTGGISPGLSRKIRLELEQQYGAAYARFLERLRLVRRRLLETVSDEARRRRVLTALVDSDVLSLYENGKVKEADRRMEEISGVKIGPESR